MRLGVSLRTAYPAGSGRDGARWLVERTRAAADAGLDSLFVGDHHVNGPDSYYQNVAILGRLLAEWQGPTAGALFLLPLWNPVLVAELVGTLATMTPSRFVVQTGIGGGKQQFAGTGEKLVGRTARFETGIDVVRRLLSGDTVSAQVGDLHIRDASIGPVPPEPVDFWIGGNVDAAIARAARLGDGFLANADHLPDELRAQAGHYLAHREQLGLPPGVVAVRRDVYVGADAHDVERVAGPVLAAGYRGFRPGVCMVGPPEVVAGQLRDLAAAGYTDVIVRQLAAEQAASLASLERLAVVREMIADA